MNDTEWAVLMSDPNTAPDYFLDALKNARDLGRDGYCEEVIGTASTMVVDSGGLNPVINALVLAAQAFDCNMQMQMSQGPVTITFEVKADAETQ